MSALPSPLNVLVAGYGLVGKSILDALTDPEFSSPTQPVQVKTFMLVKPTSLADPTKRAAIDQFVARGVTVVEGDSEQGGQLTATLKSHNIHTVVSAIGWMQYAVQYALIESCKAAGVQHFIPSDFGLDYDVLQAGHPLWDVLVKPRQDLHAAIKQSGLDWTFIATGEFTDALLSWPMLGTDLATRTVFAPASFDTQVVTTAVRDIGLLTAAAIVDPQARNQQLYTGYIVTYEQMAAALEAATGEKFTRTTRSKEELEALLVKDPTDVIPRFALASIVHTGAVWPAKQTYKYGQFSYIPIDTIARQVTSNKKAQ